MVGHTRGVFVRAGGRSSNPCLDNKVQRSRLGAAFLATRSLPSPPGLPHAIVTANHEAFPMAHDRIGIDPEIMGGKPVIRGTRIPVELLLRKLGGGMTFDAILADHPRLTREDILAAQAFAADYMADEDLIYG
jgi:uncharacterized protein (DUF433 family)